MKVENNSLKKKKLEVLKLQRNLKNYTVNKSLKNKKYLHDLSLKINEFKILEKKLEKHQRDLEIFEELLLKKEIRIHKLEKTNTENIDKKLKKLKLIEKNLTTLSTKGDGARILLDKLKLEREKSNNYKEQIRNKEFSLKTFEKQLNEIDQNNRFRLNDVISREKKVKKAEIKILKEKQKNDLLSDALKIKEQDLEATSYKLNKREEALLKKEHLIFDQDKQIVESLDDLKKHKNELRKQEKSLKMELMNLEKSKKKHLINQEQLKRTKDELLQKIKAVNENEKILNKDKLEFEKNKSRIEHHLEKVMKMRNDEEAALYELRVRIKDTEIKHEKEIYVHKAKLSDLDNRENLIRKAEDEILRAKKDLDKIKEHYNNEIKRLNLTNESINKYRESIKKIKDIKL